MLRFAAFKGGPFDGRSAEVFIPSAVELGGIVDMDGHQYMIPDNPCNRASLEADHPNLAVGLVYVTEKPSEPPHA